MAAGVVLAGILGLAGWIYLSLRPEPQPDVAKAAQSTAARAADRALTAQLDRQLDQLRAALPWATYLGTTVADSCSTGWVDHGFAITRQTWIPVTCSRATTVYEAFDGDFRPRLAQLDTALAAAGWHPDWIGTPLYRGEHPGLVAAFDDAHRPPDDPTPSESAAAAARPNVARVRYAVPISSDFVPPAGSRTTGQPSATVEVAQAPYLPLLDDGTAAHDVTLKYPSVKTSYYVDWQQYSRSQLTAAAYPAHGAVLAVSIGGYYNTSRARP
ncbi:hypothetical protein ACFW1A_22045 [Kitasatospora sp. NPDC058965]|uniref:hypothetical protein n=1 Tax=Kitasatospora sp. NPDC058965 TaxID=3346682 RepID=UPI0036ADDB94